MKTFVDKYAANVYSQQGEDGIIAECLKRIGATNRHCVEFGAHDGVFCSNTRHLIEKGWSGTMIEGDKELFERCMVNSSLLSCEVLNTMVTPANVNELVNHCAVLSIDCDGPDYGIWEAWNKEANIVVIEINSSIHPTVNAPLNDPERGTAYKPMVELAIKKGYFLLCHTGNLVFLLNIYRNLFPEIIGDGIENYKEYFREDWL